MKTLQLWFDPEIPDNIKKYMESIIKYTPNAEHYFIGDKSSSVDGQIVLDYQTELNKAYVRLGNRKWWSEYNTENKFIAEMIRLAWALDNPDLLYADADVEFISEPILLDERKLPYMGIHNRFQEHFLFYVNNCSDWFQKLINLTVSKKAPAPYIFMKTFIDIKRKWRDLDKPILWDNDTFYKRHD